MTHWSERGACSGRELRDVFFPGKGGDYTRARTICRICPVRFDCLNAALDEERTTHRDRLAGMRGGLTPPERYNLRRLFAGARG